MSKRRQRMDYQQEPLPPSLEGEWPLPLPLPLPLWLQGRHLYFRLAALSQTRTYTGRS